MTQRERMLAGQLYYSADKELFALRMKCRRLTHELNQIPTPEVEKRNEIFSRLVKKVGKNCFIEGPIYFDYGCHTEIGDDFYGNFNCTILDVGPVKIGNHVMFAPNVSIYTAGHPLDAEQRNSGWEYGIGVTIGDNVWVGGSVVINPGVTIGNNVVIGSGSVVTKDLPDNVIAVGNPARILRKITEEDKKYYFKDRPYEMGGEIQ